MELKTFRSGEYAQMNFEDGGKALLSIGGDDVRLIRLGFLSIPKETLSSLHVPDYALEPLWRTEQGEYILLGLINELTHCKDVDEAIEAFNGYIFPTPELWKALGE